VDGEGVLARVGAGSGPGHFRRSFRYMGVIHRPRKKLARGAAFISFLPSNEGWAPKGASSKSAFRRPTCGVSRLGTALPGAGRRAQPRPYPDGTFAPPFSPSTSSP